MKKLGSTMKKHLRPVLIVGAVLIAAGIVGAVVSGSHGDRPGLESLDQQFAGIATRYHFQPLLPPRSRIALPAVSVSNSEPVENCWEGNVTERRAFEEVAMVSASVADENTDVSLGFLEKLGYKFSASGRSAESVNLKLDDWNVIQAADLRFRWENDECWSLLALGTIPVVGEALQFGRIRAELLGAGGAVIKVDSFVFDHGERLNAQGEVTYHDVASISGTAKDVSIGVGVWRYLVREWSCPYRGAQQFRTGEPFRTLSGCADGKSNTASWYRIRLNCDSNNNITAEFQRIGQASDSVYRVPVTIGAEVILVRRAKNTDRLLVERNSDSTFSLSVTRYELWPLREFSPNEAAARARGMQGSSLEFSPSVQRTHSNQLRDPETREVSALDSLRLFVQPSGSRVGLGYRSLRNPESFSPLTGTTELPDRTGPYSDDEAERPFQLSSEYKLGVIAY
jgi:hypothetical protein